jgi:hypothetical protein
MRTKSVWGPAPTRYYRFLHRVIDQGVRDVVVLGCADGRFVMGFARAGIPTTAVDIDRISLWGGPKKFPDGIRIIPGLAKRLQEEGLQGNVTIIEDDYVTSNLGGHGAAFTSGSIHYSYNLRHTLRDIVAAIVRSVTANGLLYVDYMLPMEKKHKGRPNYPERGVLVREFELQGCDVIYDRYSGPRLERAHVEQPHDHYHSIGYILAIRRRVSP